MKTHLHMKKFFKRWSLYIITWIYVPFLLIIGIIACYFAYIQKQERLYSTIDFTFQQLEKEYNSTIENFSQLYLSIFENHSTNYDTILNYFSYNLDTDLSPMNKANVITTLRQMLTQDSRVQWIALYSDERDANYIMFKSENYLHVLPEDFPYLENMAQKSTQMEVYGAETVINANTASPLNTYAICGGVPTNMGNGKIIAGYTLAPFETIVEDSRHTLESLNYMIVAGNNIVYNSSGNFDESIQSLPQLQANEKSHTSNLDNLFTYSIFGNSHTATLSYQLSKQAVFFYSHQNTPFILLIVFLFVASSFIVNSFVIKQTSKEVDIIRQGLLTIGNNNLNYQISTSFQQPSLNEIADSINQMTMQLNENINRAYYYELKQKEAELSELQSKFNPHFLYNTLEMIRSRCVQSGDAQTANLVAQLANIFRGFLSSKTVVSLSEELTFSKRYLALFGARYKDHVEILYEVDNEVLQYGIIRNVFQPLIENYFVHGFDTSSDRQNYIRIIGKSLDEQYMMLTVEDNGCGLTDEALKKLNSSLNEPIVISNESYGLKNLHQRLRLFYGEDCGLSIIQNADHGISVNMKVKKLKCD